MTYNHICTYVSGLWNWWAQETSVSSWNRIYQSVWEPGGLQKVSNDQKMRNYWFHEKLLDQKFVDTAFKWNPTVSNILFFLSDSSPRSTPTWRLRPSWRLRRSRPDSVQCKDTRSEPWGGHSTPSEIQAELVIFPLEIWSRWNKMVMRKRDFRSIVKGKFFSFYLSLFLSLPLSLSLSLSLSFLTQKSKYFWAAGDITLFLSRRPSFFSGEAHDIFPKPIFT